MNFIQNGKVSYNCYELHIPYQKGNSPTIPKDPIDDL